MENGEKGDRDERAPSAGKIFVGGLSRETSTEKLTKHFMKYGDIIDSVVMKHRNTRQPRGFGFVTFADPSVIDKVMIDTHLIDGRTVEIKRSIPRENMVKGPRTRKIFVGGLLPSISEDEFKKYFSQFGPVVDSQIMLEHGTGRPRGFGFITFDDEQVVDDLLSQGNTLELEGKQIEIKKAEPKKSSDEPVRGFRSPAERRGYGYGSGGRSSYDDSYNHRAGYGGGEEYGMRFASYGDGLGAYGGGAGYSSGYASSSLGGYGPSGGNGERYSRTMFSQFDGEPYGGMSFGSNNSGYGGGGYGGTGYGGGMYGSPGGYRGGYGPTSPNVSGYGYGRGSGRYHPYGRN